jgi:hypothetical protein
MTLRWIGLPFAPLAALTAFALGSACGNTSAPSPFTTDAGSDADGSGGADTGSVFDAGEEIDPTLGGPCLDDGQCNDNIDCTFDECDKTLGRCRNIPDDSKCQDSVYCNGMEVCELRHGCVAGAPITCEDGNECTVDTCVEATQSCKHAPRDADGDGDPDGHCPGGHDCNDNDPTVSSLLPEVCANGKDDNCNGQIDEMPCVSPQHQTCLTPLQISASGTYAMDTTGCTYMYPTSCGLSATPGAKDVVAAILLPAGPPVDVEVTAHTPGDTVSVTIAGTCGDPATEIECGPSFPSAMGGQTSRVRGRALGSMTQATAYPVYVDTAGASTIALDVQFLPVTPQPTNVSCGTAVPITPGTPVAMEILDLAMNVGSACMTALGSLVYSFTLAAASDVNIYATSIDGIGNPVVSLRDSGCALPTDEIACQTTQSVHLYQKDLAAGTYYVAVSATAATSLELTVDLASPTMPAPDQSCTGAPVIPPNKTIPVQLSTHQDTVNLGCNPGAVNAAYELDLASNSDVLLVERFAMGDTGAVGLATPACTANSALACMASGQTPVRVGRRNVPAGAYRVVPTSLTAQDVQLTAFVRDAVPPTLVPFANGCAQAQPIPETGGFFQGNTANATPNFPAGCDLGAVQGNGAPDQLLSLTLTSSKRVILDMEGSGYNTILDVRQGPSCPGAEIPMGCTVGFPPSRSYLDLLLAAGTYYVQVDGYDLDKGPWFLDVRVVDP